MSLPEGIVETLLLFLVLLLLGEGNLGSLSSMHMLTRRSQRISLAGYEVINTSLIRSMLVL